LITRTSFFFFFFCSARPFTVASRKPLICLIIVAGALAYTVYGALNLLPSAPIYGPHLRLFPAPNAAAGLSSAGLLQQGCELPGAAAAAGAAGAAVLLNLTPADQPDGWWFEPGAAGPLLVEQADDPGGPWRPVRYPPWVPRAAAWAAGTGRAHVDLRTPWQWRVQYASLVVKAVLIAAGCGLGLFAGRGRRGALALAAGFALMALVATITAAAASAGGAKGGYRFGPEGAAAGWTQARRARVLAAAQPLV
jgi:hypothetical protein